MYKYIINFKKIIFKNIEKKFIDKKLSMIYK